MQRRSKGQLLTARSSYEESWLRSTPSTSIAAQAQEGGRKGKLNQSSTARRGGERGGGTGGRQGGQHCRLRQVGPHSLQTCRAPTDALYSAPGSDPRAKLPRFPSTPSRRTLRPLPSPSLGNTLPSFVEEP